MLNPLNDRLVVKRIDPEKTSAGGIIIPGVAEKKSDRARVVAVGPGGWTESGARRPMRCKVGDEVVFERHYGVEVRVDGEDLLILRDDNVMAVVDVTP